MPTYEDIRGYFAESETLQNVARQAAEVPIVTGFTLDIHPLWTLLYDLEDGTLAPDFPIDLWIDRLFARWDLTGVWPHSGWSGPAFQGYRKRDLWQPLELWSKLPTWSGRKAKGGPVVLTLVHRPISTPLAGETNPSEGDEADRARLIAIANESEAFVLVEERPQARLAFAPGDAIRTSQGRSGTCGGTLIDSNGTPYGMSCAHVAETGDAITDHTGTHLGHCAHHTALVPLGANSVCDPVLLPAPNPSPGNGPQVNMLDLSLIDLAQTPTPTHTLGGVAASLTIGQDVVVDGARTFARCRLGSLALSYAFWKDGQTFCFRDSIELVPRPRFGLAGPLGTLFSPLPTQGDSGAWVLTEDTPPAWAGVLFGEDGQRGYCIRASWAHAWAENILGPLSV